MSQKFWAIVDQDGVIALLPRNETEAAKRRQNVGLDVPRPQRILGLQRADGVGGVGPADRVGTCFGQAEEAHLAGLDQARHRAHGVLDGYLWVDAVDAIAADFGVEVDEMPWARDVELTDPDGNRIRVAEPR